MARRGSSRARCACSRTRYTSIARAAAPRPAQHLSSHSRYRRLARHEPDKDARGPDRLRWPRSLRRAFPRAHHAGRLGLPDHRREADPRRPARTRAACRGCVPDAGAAAGAGARPPVTAPLTSSSVRAAAGPEQNERLTHRAAVVLVVLLAAEGLTLLA